MALRRTTIGMSSVKVLCRSAKHPFLKTMCVFDLRSCVEEVTAEWIWPLESLSTMIRFFDSWVCNRPNQSRVMYSGCIRVRYTQMGRDRWGKWESERLLFY